MEQIGINLFKDPQKIDILMILNFTVSCLETFE